MLKSIIILFAITVSGVFSHPGGYGGGGNEIRKKSTQDVAWPNDHHSTSSGFSHNSHDNNRQGSHGFGQGSDRYGGQHAGGSDFGHGNNHFGHEDELTANRGGLHKNGFSHGVVTYNHDHHSTSDGFSQNNRQVSHGFGQGSDRYGQHAGGSDFGHGHNHFDREGGSTTHGGSHNSGFGLGGATHNYNEPQRAGQSFGGSNDHDGVYYGREQQHSHNKKHEGHRGY